MTNIPEELPDAAELDHTTNIELSDIIDAPALQVLMDAYFSLTGLGFAILDIKGAVLIAGGWQDICVKFHRTHPESCKFCLESDISLSRGVAPGTFKTYRCKNNLWDIATPIMLGERHIGNIFMGQLLFDDETVDYELFRAQAKRFGYDEAAYIAALDRVPRYSRETVNTGMHFCSKLAQMISRSNFNNILLARTMAKRARAEEALLYEKQFSEDTLAALPGVFYVLDTTGLLVRHNSQLSKVSGYSDTELATMRGTDFFVGDHQRRVGEAIQRVFVEGQADVEADVQTKDGQKLPYHFTGQRSSIGGQTYMLGIGIDLTERKRADAEKLRIQAQLTQAQKTESLGRMAGAIAHTFNNKLSVVIGNLEMAIEELPRDAKPLPLLTDAMQGARKAAEVSGLMLTYLGKTNSLHVPLDLSESCRKSLPLLQAGDSHGIILKVNLPSPGPTISANANQIQQAYANLITNAREAIGEKQGMVTLTVKTVPQTDISTVNRYPLDWQAQDATYACLEVTDTGCGIANECLDKIFDPFYSTKFPGRGLGLPIVSGIASAHGGVITVASEEHGSTFRLFLPLSTEEIPRQTVETVQPIVSKGRGTVLLIDDDEMIRNMAKAMLMSLDYKVLAAKDGIEAVEIFARGQDEIRCVVSDLTMPRMNGWKTLAALRKLSPDIPVILSSGYDEAQVLIGDHPERPQAFLHKPYNMNELKAALAKAMED